MAYAEAAGLPIFDLLEVRPYLLTGGRTMGDVELTLEAQLQVTDQGTDALPELNLEREEIIRLCLEPTSVAELAGRLDLPLQVSRVLVCDLIEEGLLALHVPVDSSSERPDLTLLERVLDGLQKL